jgi:hypothetical protein
MEISDFESVAQILFSWKVFLFSVYCPFRSFPIPLRYAITCIVSQVAASAGFFAPSTSTLTS